MSVGEGWVKSRQRRRPGDVCGEWVGKVKAKEEARGWSVGNGWVKLRLRRRPGDVCGEWVGKVKAKEEARGCLWGMCG